MNALLFNAPLGQRLGAAGEALGGVVGTVLLQGLVELEAREELQQLREDASTAVPVIARGYYYGIVAIDAGRHETDMSNSIQGV